jgi:hypothetical protein
MNPLVKFLIESFITENKISYNDIKNVVGLYSGRFQPAGKHHKKAFLDFEGILESRFPDKNVNCFVATSNKVEFPKSPLNFQEKKKVWLKHGLSDNQIVETKNPYNVEEITSKYNPSDTIVIYLVGKKDAERLGGKKKDGNDRYHIPLTKDSTEFYTFDEHSYFLIANHVSEDADGEEMNGSRIRDLFSKATNTNKPYIHKLFQDIFGWYDDEICKIFIDKFKKTEPKQLKESPDEVFSDSNSVAQAFDNDAWTFIIKNKTWIYAKTDSKWQHPKIKTYTASFTHGGLGVFIDTFARTEEEFKTIFKKACREYRVGWNGTFEDLTKIRVECLDGVAREVGISGRIWGRKRICSTWKTKEESLKMVEWKTLMSMLISDFGGIESFQFDFVDRHKNSNLFTTKDLDTNKQTISKDQQMDLFKRQHLDPNAKSALGKKGAGSTKYSKTASNAGFKSTAQFNHEKDRNLQEGNGFGFIKHVDDLKPVEVLDFLKNWNKSTKEFVVNEKVDGHFYKFGIENGKFYTEDAKKTKYFTEKDYPKIYFFDTFRNYHSILSKIPFPSILEQLSKKYKINDINNFEIQSESVPRSNHNIIKYDENIIGNGIIIVINMTIDSQRVSPSLIKDFCDIVNKYSSIKLFSTPILNLQNFKFEESIIKELEDIITKFGKVLSKPARTEQDKQIKNEIKNKISRLSIQAKNSMLKFDFKKSFGDDFEGLVIYLPDGNILKMVDKEKFTQGKIINWKQIEDIDTAVKEFKKTVISNPKSIKIELKKLINSLKNTEMEFEDNKKNMLPAKVTDTEKHFQMTYNFIDNVKNLLSKESETEISKKIQDRLLEKKLLKEGGNTFPEMNSRTKKEWLLPTINNAIKLIFNHPIKFELIGNNKKDVLGDIDVGLHFDNLAKAIGYEGSYDKEKFFSSLEKFLSKTNVKFKVNRGLHLFNVLVKAIDDNGKFPKPIDDNGNIKNINEPATVQIDFFIGDVDWMKNAYSGAGKESGQSSEYKAAIRNALFTNILAHSEELIDSEKNIYKKYVLNVFGLQEMIYTKTPSGGRKEIAPRKIVAKSMDDAVKLVINPNISFKDVDTYEGMLRQVKSNNFVYKNKRSEIFDSFKTQLKNKTFKKLPPFDELN